MAGDPHSGLLLVGMGVDKLSMTPSALPEVKRAIRSTSFNQLQALGEDVLNMQEIADIRARVNATLSDEDDERFVGGINGNGETALQMRLSLF